MQHDQDDRHGEELDALFDWALEELQARRQLDLTDWLDGRGHLREAAEAVLATARQVSVRPSDTLPHVPGFVIERELGRGGMGRVFLARDERLDGRLVALKVLPHAILASERARERFRREVRALARLRHPGIVAVYGTVDTDEVQAYSMEWIDGSSLSRLIATRTGSKRGGLDRIRTLLGGAPLEDRSETEFFARRMASVARAVAAVHSAGLLHRDIKPANVLVRRDGTALLTDFGLIRDESATSLTRTEGFLGTPAFAPPEQLEGKELDARSDVYSLGVSLYQCLLGELPHSGRTPAALLNEIREGRPSRLRTSDPRISRDLETVVLTSMAVDPADRYSTAAALAEDLTRLLDSRPILARRPGPAIRLVRALQRNRKALVGGIVGAGLALVVALSLVFYAVGVPRLVDRWLTQARLELLNPSFSELILVARERERGWPVGSGSEQVPGSIEGTSRYRRAIALYDRILRLQPWNDVARRERVVSQAACSHLDSLLGGAGSELPSAELAGLREQGLFAFLTGNAAEAVRTWGELDLPNGEDRFIDAGLGMLYLQTLQPERAYARLELACDAFPQAGFLVTALADAALRCGDVDQAQQRLDLAAELPFQDPFEHRIEIAADLAAWSGRLDDAERLYVLQTGRHKSARAWMHLAGLQERTGRLELSLLSLASLDDIIPAQSHRDALVRAANDWWSGLAQAEQVEIVARELCRTQSVLGSLRSCLRAVRQPVLSGPDRIGWSIPDRLKKHWDSMNALARTSSPGLHGVRLQDLHLTENLLRAQEANPMALSYRERSWLARSALSLDHILTRIPVMFRGSMRAVLSAGLARSRTIPGICTGLIPSLLLGVPAAAQSWVLVDTTGVLARQEAAMAYDSVRQEIVVFGGSAAGLALDDTWTRKNGQWVQQAPSARPSPRWEVPSCFDEARQVTLLFGGVGASGSSSDTWQWDGMDWTDVTPAGPGPSKRHGAGLAYDSDRQVVVLFGGYDASSGFLRDTWEWSGPAQGWAQVASTGPTARYEHGMVYDPGRQKVVLFGGWTGAVNGETWEWDGSSASWTQIATATSPSPRFDHGMVFHELEATTVLFGGSLTGSGSSVSNQTWSWDGSSWNLLATVGNPGPRRDSGIAYDRERDVVVLFDGNGQDGETWELCYPVATGDYSIDFEGLGIPEQSPAGTIGIATFDGEIAIQGAPAFAFGGSGGLSTADKGNAAPFDAAGNTFVTHVGGSASPETTKVLNISFATAVTALRFKVADIDSAPPATVEELRMEIFDAAGTSLGTVIHTAPQAGGLGDQDVVEIDFGGTSGIRSLVVELRNVGTTPTSSMGWGLDDLSFSVPPVTYCTAGVSASGCQATISSAGMPSSTASSGFQLLAAGVEGAKDGMFFFGTSGRQANPWGNGASYQCVMPPVVRAGLLTSTGTAGSCDGAFSQDLNALWCATCPKPSKNPGPGALVQAQLWYRDPQSSSNQTTSLSDAIEFALCP